MLITLTDPLCKGTNAMSEYYLMTVHRELREEGVLIVLYIAT